MSAAPVRILARVVTSIIGLAVVAGTNPLQAQTGTRYSADNTAWVSIAKPHLYADVMLDTDIYSGVYTLMPNAADIGRSARIFLVARVDQHWYSNDGQKWLPWTSGRTGDLAVLASGILGNSEKLQFISDQNLQSGDYEIFAGYQVGSEPLIYNQQPLQFTVNSSSSETLLPFASDNGLEAYLKQGMQLSANRDAGQATGDTSSGGIVNFVASPAASGLVSSTNVQVQGVDEADIIKVDGNNLYQLASCDEGTCLNVDTLDSANAKAPQLASLTLDTAQAPDGMFLVEHGILGQKMMVTVGGQNNYIRNWMSIWGWGQSKTELDFINVSDPQKPSSINKLALDGTLVESRAVGNILYLVTRFTPGLPGFQPYPTLQTDTEGNSNAVAKAGLDDMLPHIVDSSGKSDLLVDTKNCFLPASAVDANDNPTIITITSIPLDSPSSFASTCFLGNSETLYMTEDSLYLATTNWHYDIEAVDPDTVVYSPDHTTSIHKFALNNGSVEYRGSGEAKGHLGWDQDKKSFRMGEHNGYLNIATSLGESWSGTASTRLSVLKEDANKHALQTVNVIDGIGADGDQLYAARFLGDRGYLVTYRVTDPLYVLDLSNQEQPRMAGELKIDGYSDYLHPVSDTLLVGIGKAAVIDAGDPNGGDGRGAWYQGVQLSLFDVSDISNPKEVNSVVLGKRGTDSDVLWDHHALSFLPAVGNEPARLSIPVQLHATIPAWDGFDASDPGAWYDFTDTALYSFEISNSGISTVGRLIGELPATDTPVRPALCVMGADDCNSGSTPSGFASTNVANSSVIAVDPGFVAIRPYARDRSVLKDDAVFYIHNGKVLSSYWGEDK